VTALFVVLSFCHTGRNFSHAHLFGMRRPCLLKTLVTGHSVSRGISDPRAKVILLLSIMRVQDSPKHLLLSATGAQRASLEDCYFWGFPLSLQQQCCMSPGLKLGVLGKIVPCEPDPPSARHLHYGFVLMWLCRWQKIQCVTGGTIRIWSYPKLKAPS